MHSPPPISTPPPSPPATSRGSWRSLVLRLAVTLGLMALALRGVDAASLREQMAATQWRWWGIGLVVALCLQVMGGIRWAALARPLGFDFPLRFFIARFFEGSFFGLFLPTSIGGDVFKAYRLSDTAHGRLLAGCTVLADRLSGLAALVVVGSTAFLAREWSLGSISTILLGATLLASVMIPVRLAVGALDRIVAALPPHLRIGRFLSGLLPYQRQPGLFVRAIAWSMFVQMGVAIVVACAGRAAGAPLPLSYWFEIVPVVSLAMVLPLSIGGLGVREEGLTRMLAPAGVPAETAIAIGLLWFLTTIVCGLVGGALFLTDRSPSTSIPNRGARESDAAAERIPTA